MERQKYNKLILEKLSKLVDKYPDLRFGQILVNCDIIQLEECLLEGERQTVIKGIDPFYEESEITWNRLSMNKFAFKEKYN